VRARKEREPQGSCDQGVIIGVNISVATPGCAHLWCEVGGDAKRARSMASAACWWAGYEQVAEDVGGDPDR